MFAFPKPTREDRVLEKRQRRTAIETHEATEKAKVVRRDGAHYCRLVPGCKERELHETAHLDDKGMGGDPQGLRTQAETMIRACFFHHQGKWSLHSGALRVEYLTPAKANGPIEVWAKDQSGGEYLVGRERAVGMWERD